MYTGQGRQKIFRLIFPLHSHPLISHIAEMQGEFANTLAIEMGTDGASRVREVA